MSDIFRILFAIEMRLFLRNKLALFWMVVFPILLFAILYGAFGGPSSLGSLTLQMVDLDRSSRSEAFLNFLHRGLADNRSVDVAIVPAADSGPVARDALRLTIPRGFDRAFGESGVSTVTVAPGPGDTIAQHAVIGMVLGLNTEFNSMAGHVPQRSRIVVSKSPIVNDLGYGQYLTVGVVVMTIISTCLMGFTTPIVALRENGILKTYSAMPISKPVFMAALLTSRVILVVAFTALFLLAVRFVFGVEIRCWPAVS